MARQAKLQAELQHKRSLRDHLQQQLSQELSSFQKLERDTAAIISRAKHSSGKLMVRCRAVRVEGLLHVTLWG